jgi:hypothetical protein
MKPTTRRERAALAQADTIGEAEANRDAWWLTIDLRTRQRACGVAGLPKEQAEMPLVYFSDADRQRVRLALAAHIGQMELIIKCMSARNTNVQGWLH